MQPYYCDMVKTDEEHATIKGLMLYRCARTDCGRTFWSYSDSIKIPCRHVRGTVETLVNRVVDAFKPNRKQRRAAAAAKPAVSNGPKPVGNAQKIWNLGKALAEWAADRRSVSEEAYAARLDVCNACPHRDDTKCKLCGCYLAAKARAVAWHCPAFKWEGDIGMSQLLCVIPFTHTSQRQDLVMLMQSASRSTKLTVLDCVGDYVPFAAEDVVKAPNFDEGLRTVCDGKYYAYAFMQPHVRGSQLLSGMLWAQQLSSAGIVTPVYSATRKRVTAENKKAGNFYWRNVPAASPEMFLITQETVEKLGLPPQLDDFTWALHIYSMHARMQGVPVVEAWTCQQTQDPPPLNMPSETVLSTLAARFGPYWDMLHNDARVRLPSTPPAS